MDPRYSAQDILLCDLCEINLVQSYCELCQNKLCKCCVGEHLSESTKNHRVVPYKASKLTPSYQECPNHAGKLCELYCEKCYIFICTICISSGKHHGHTITDVCQKVSSKKEELEKDLDELQESIYRQYVGLYSEITSNKGNLEKQYRKLTSAIINHGEGWHRVIDIIVKKQISKIDHMKKRHLAAFNQQETDFLQNISKLEQFIVDVKNVLENNDISQILSYKSRNIEFRKFPSKLKVSLPTFSPQTINELKVSQQFGSMKDLCMTTEEQYYTTTTQEPPVKKLIINPELIATIYTRYTSDSVTCFNDEKIWTCSQEGIMKLFNLQGKLLESIKTNSFVSQGNITMTNNKDLVYIDSRFNTINLLKKTKKTVVIQPRRHWEPISVCSTSSGDLLVTMNSTTSKESKVVRYSNFTEIQSIQLDEKHKPLFSLCNKKHISENRNLDICVADCSAQAVVVVNKVGKLRFRYTGRPPIVLGCSKELVQRYHSLFVRESFTPYGITTDSQSQILTSDKHRRIHILDQDGQFLRFIDNCDLCETWSLCVDCRDNLLVAECGCVKKIKYMETY